MNLQSLIPTKKFNCADYTRMLKALFPKGRLWNFELGECVLTPDWVALDTYIGDDFDSGSVDSWWDSDFKNEWIPTRYPPTSSDFAAVNSDDTVAILVSKSNSIGGDFVLEAGMILGPTDTIGANRSFRFDLLDQADDWICSIYWEGDQSKELIWSHTTPPTMKDDVSVDYLAYKKFKVRITRVGTLITGSYNIGAGWVDFSNPFNDSSDVYVRVNSAEDPHGFSYFQFQADSGLESSSTPSISGSVLGRIVATMGAELDRFEQRVTDLKREAIPGLSVELLTDWETMAGLPDECEALASTLYQRQLNVHAKITGEYTTLSEQFFIDYAASIGVTIEIGEADFGEAFITGLSVCGDRLGGIELRSVWVVYLVDPTQENIPLMQCTFNKLKPAHTAIVYTTRIQAIGIISEEAFGTATMLNP